VRTLDHLFARRVSRRSAVQLFGAAPVLAHGALAAGPTALRSAHSAPPATTAAADRLFEAGQFVAADAAYARILAHDPHNVHALTQRGSIALLSNRLAQAQALLTKSLTLAPGNPLARALLALTLYRADDFAQAAKLGCEPPLLESFQGSTPYAIQRPGDQPASLPADRSVALDRRLGEAAASIIGSDRAKDWRVGQRRVLPAVLADDRHGRHAPLARGHTAF
jgi:hypothetical protein